MVGYTAILCSSEKLQEGPPTVSIEPRHPSGVIDTETMVDHSGNIPEESSNVSNESLSNAHSLTIEPQCEPRGSSPSESCDFVPDGLIRFLPETVRIRVKPRQAWEIIYSHAPPNPPPYVEPIPSQIKMGMSRGPYRSTPLESDEEIDKADDPVFLQATAPVTRLDYRDARGRPIPEEAIRFDGEFKRLAARIAEARRLTSTRTFELEQSKKEHAAHMHQWRRTFPEQETVETKSDNRNLIVFFPDTTEEVNEQNELDRKGMIQRWFNSRALSLLIADIAGLKEDGPVNPPLTIVQAETAPSAGCDKAENEKRKVEQDSDNSTSLKWNNSPTTDADDCSNTAGNSTQQKRDAGKKTKKERRKEAVARKQLKSRKECRAKREQGLLPETPCPRCQNSGHWKIDCPSTKTKSARLAKKVIATPVEDKSPELAGNPPTEGEKEPDIKEEVVKSEDAFHQSD